MKIAKSPLSQEAPRGYKRVNKPRKRKAWNTDNPSLQRREGNLLESVKGDPRMTAGPQMLRAISAHWNSMTQEEWESRMHLVEKEAVKPTPAHFPAVEGLEQLRPSSLQDPRTLTNSSRYSNSGPRLTFQRLALKKIRRKA